MLTSLVLLSCQALLVFEIWRLVSRVATPLNKLHLPLVPSYPHPLVVSYPYQLEASYPHLLVASPSTFNLGRRRMECVSLLDLLLRQVLSPIKSSLVLIHLFDFPALVYCVYTLQE